MLDALSRILALIRKELLAMLKDPRARIMLFLPPVLESLLFGYAATYDLNTVRYAVLDQDRSPASQALLADLDGSRVFVRAANLEQADEAERYIDERRVLLVVQIPQDFSRDLAAGRTASVQVVADGRNSNTAGTALAYINTVVQSFGNEWRADHGSQDAVSPNAGGKPQAAVSSGADVSPEPAVKVVARAWYNPALETRWHMIPSLIGTLTMLQTLLLTAMSVAREREEGTFDQLLVTPLRPSEIMIGKAVPSMLVGAAQATLILFVAQLWFRIPFAGSFITLYAGLALFLLAAVGIGLMVSSFVATMQQAMLFSFVLLMPFILLSGLATPIANMPPVLQRLTLANPLRYAIDLAERVYLEGAGLGQIAADLWPLAVIAAFTLPVASWMFRNRLT